MELLPEIQVRKSIRQFMKDAVPKDVMSRILEAGARAPSAKNRQEWRFVVVQKEDIRKKIQDAAFGQDYVGQAPAIIAACTTNIDYRMPNGHLSFPVDLTFGVSFMMFQAVHEGLGTCCITTFDEQEVKEILTVPFSMRVVMLLLVGYPAGEPEETTRKPLKRVISYEHW
ncbi:MAG: nitroreductase [Spirochaetaceae bacterium]|nr:MAG: nitroreductase [Spirochaetaceae bacterium]